jgi:hypothetical protein
MIHDLDLGPDAGVNHALAVLRGLDFEGDLVARRHLVPGLCLDWDAAGDITVHGTSRPGRLLDLEVTVARPGRWLSLNLTLGAADLTGRHVLGLLCKSAGRPATTFQPCLRSGLEEGGFTDHFFRKRVLAHDRPGIYLDALLPGPAAGGPPLRAPWREIVLFFRPETSRIELLDLRLFIL